jgi:alkylated DNA repair dioxygenase AlkB
VTAPELNCDEQRQMYDRLVQVPRLVASLPDDGPLPHLLERMRAALAGRYRVAFERVSLAYYRDGQDSVAFHGDRIARTMADATAVATVSLGARRRFLLRRNGGGGSLGWELGEGDLLVMGGTCQRTWQHGIPKVKGAGPRIAVMFRPAWVG